MYKQKLLFWCSFFYYLVNIYSIVVAVNLYLQGGNTNTTYFITFFSIFGIDKLLILIITYGHEDGCSGFIFAICDIFQIGFVYIFFDDNYQQYNLGNALKTKVYSRIIPQIIMEFIFFFCLRDLVNSNNSESVQIATLINFILFLVLFCSLLFIIKGQSQYYYSYHEILKKDYKRQLYYYFSLLLNLMPYYLSICAFSLYQDKFGINLGYYIIVMAFLSIIGYVIYIRPNSDIKLVEFIFNYLCFNGQRVNYYDFDCLTKTQIYLMIATQINQMIRVLILFIFCQNDIFQRKDSIRVQQVLIIMTLAVSFISFIYLFYESYVYLFKTKIINIFSQGDIKSANILLQNKRYTNFVIYLTQSNNSQHNLHQQLISETDLRNEILTLVKLISQLERKNRQAVIKQIEVLYYYQAIEYFKEYKDEIISSLIDIDDHLLIELCYYTREEYLIKMFNQRVQNGFILNQTTYQIVDWISSKKKEYQILQPFKSCQLQVTLFNKMFSPLMQFQPTQILYDLYEDY
ncbi:hypothetical protein ABPG74_000730 [Tetrahymena malaccensis]